jgi:uncharacterized protein YraI
MATQTPPLEETITATPVATQTPEGAAAPTEAPMPTDVGTTLATVAFESNLRAGPGSEFDVLTLISTGTQLEVPGRDVSGRWAWVRIPETGQEGWIAFTQLTGEYQVPQIPIAPDIPTIEPSAEETPTEVTPMEDASST